MLMENSTDLNAGIIQRHIAYLRKIDKMGKLGLCGWFTDYAGGMVVINADCYDEADQISKADPFIAEGYKTYKLRTLERATLENNYGTE